MAVGGLPITLVQVVQSLHVRCNLCERPMPFVILFHHIAEVHNESADGGAVREIMAWVDAQESQQARVFMGILFAAYTRWKMENPE